jgi:hypothetical protein
MVGLNVEENPTVERPVALDKTLTAADPIGVEV